MAHFRFNPMQMLGLSLTDAPTNVPARADPAILREAPADPHATLRVESTSGPDPAAAGPGWFESSWDLIRGLDVHERHLADAALNAWIVLRLRQPHESTAGSVFAQGHEQPGSGLVPAPSHGAFGDALEFGDLDLAVPAEIAHLDQFSQFGIDALELA
jgi:hypothetical protein